MEKWMASVALLLLATTAQAQSPAVPLPGDVETLLNTSPVHSPRVRLGSQVTQKKLNVMKAVYDVSVLGGPINSTIVLKDAAGGFAFIPDNAIIKNAIIHVLGNPQGLGSSISFGVGSTTDLLDVKGWQTYTASSFVQGIPVNTTVTFARITNGPTTVKAAVTGATVTTGKFNVFIEYYLGSE